MSKLFVTNSNSVFSRVREGIKLTPFEESFVYEGDSVYSVATKKLLVDHINSFQRNDDYVIQNGTMVYRDSHGSPALNQLLNEFTGDVEGTRNSLKGNYGVVIKKGEHYFAFTEASACYDLFYYNDGEMWFVSSSLWDMVAAVKSKLTVNRLNILEELARYTIINNETYFNEIKKLGGDEYIHISRDGFEIKEIPYGITAVPEEKIGENIKDISEEIKRVAKLFYNNYGNPTIGATGGLDSRMSLAAYLSVGCKPKLTYGLGNSFLAPSMQGDYDIDKLFSDKFDLEFDCSPWNETIPIDKNWHKYIPKYGNLIYDGNEDTFKFYTKKDEPFVIFGYMGEFFREFEWIERIDSEYLTIDQYFDGFYAEPNRALFDYFTELRAHVINKMRCYCTKHKINPEKIKKEEMFYLNLEYRHRADSSMVNLLNRFKYSHYLLSEMSVLKNTYIPFKLKYKAGYMLRIMNEIKPEVLAVPFFSHCMLQSYDSQQIELREMRKPYLNRIKGIIPLSIKNWLKEKGIYRNKALNKYDPIIELLGQDNNQKYIKDLFETDNLGFVNANPDSMFIVRALIINKQMRYYAQ